MDQWGCSNVPCFCYKYCYSTTQVFGKITVGILNFFRVTLDLRLSIKLLKSLLDMSMVAMIKLFGVNHLQDIFCEICLLNLDPKWELPKVLPGFSMENSCSSKVEVVRLVSWKFWPTWKELEEGWVSTLIALFAIANLRVLFTYSGIVQELLEFAIVLYIVMVCKRTSQLDWESRFASNIHYSNVCCEGLQWCTVFIDTCCYMWKWRNKSLFF